MERKELTDLIPLWGLYDVYKRKDDVLDFHEREALRDNDELLRLARNREINPTEHKQRSEAIVKEFNKKCRNMIVYSAGVAAYNLIAAYGFFKLIEYFSR